MASRVLTPAQVRASLDPATLHEKMWSTLVAPCLFDSGRHFRECNGLLYAKLAIYGVDEKKYGVTTHSVAEWAKCKEYAYPGWRCTVEVDGCELYVRLDEIPTNPVAVDSDAR